MVVVGTSVSHAEYNAVAAAPQSVVAAPSRTPEPVDDYSGWLVLSYLATPALAIGLPVLASELKLSRGENAALGISGFTVALALPAIAHWLNDDDWRGWRALIGLPACTAVGVVFGLILGAAGGTDKSSGAGNAVGAVFGLVLGFLGASVWSVYDIAETASERGKRRTAARRMRFAALPQPGGGVVAVTGSF